MDTRCALSRTNTDDEYWQPATPISSSQLTLATACLKIHEVLIPLTFQNEHSHVAKIYIYMFLFFYLFIMKNVLNIELFLLAMT